MELRLKSDTAKRKWFFTPESFSHPAKCHLGLLEWIVFTFTQEGDVVLDPMLGSGTTLYATLLGRSVIGVELESKFVKMAEDNLKKLNQMPLYLGVKQRGQAQIIQGDARQLENILRSSVDKCMFSPPFAEAKFDYRHGIKGELSPDLKGRKVWEQRFDGNPENPDNIANLPYGEIDKIITSPPYAEAQSGGGIAKHGYQGSKHSPTDLVGKRSYMPENIGGGDNISNLPYGQIDAVVAPYDAINKANIGNLYKDTYLGAMALVYSQCYKVLRAGGLLILVVRNFIRNKKEIDLRGNTVRLCEHVGFRFLEEHYRILPNQSFWRTIYRRHHPSAPVLDREYILVFRR